MSPAAALVDAIRAGDRKSTRLNSSHLVISYAVFCLKKNTSELQSPCNLVCRLLLEKKKILTSRRNNSIILPFERVVDRIPSERISSSFTPHNNSLL